MDNTTKTNMLELVIGLVAKVGIDAALIILTNMANVTTVKEAITALEVSRNKTWEDYKKEA